MKELKKENQYLLDDNRIHTEEIKVWLLFLDFYIGIE